MVAPPTSSSTASRRFALLLAIFLAALAGGLVARLAPIGGGGLERPPGNATHGETQVLALPALVRQTAPAVVNIAVLQPSPLSQNPLLQDPFFRQYLGVPETALQPTISAGSGVIVDARRGLVVTNFHVVENATAVEVGLKDGRRLAAEPVGVAPALDLAVLRIRGAKLPALPFGDSSALQVGDQVVAIGNPFGLGQTVTAGIVSATDRGLAEGDSRRFIQTDAPINPGNSGGPLINTKGEIVGINSALISPNQGNVGIGFAIPATVVRRVVAEAAK